MTPPGLRFIPNFVSSLIQSNLQAEALDLHRALAVKALGTPSIRTRTYLSAQHNLSTDERYKKIVLDRNIQCQHFEKYGEPGHQLTYFIGNKNIPEFVKTHLVFPMARLHEVQALGNGALDWNFTFNTYAPVDSSTVPGFPFHTDIPSNGAITSIFTLLSEATLEIKKDQETCSYTLIPGSLLLLSGDSRWNWQHRVLPKKVDALAHPVLSRISLVLGCSIKV